MAPPIKITREEIAQAAVKLVRAEGLSSLNARRLAKELKTSTQPIFSNFDSMEAVKQEVIHRAYLLFLDRRQKEMKTSSDPPYKALGLSYIRFAKEEKNLFQLLYMRDRSLEPYPSETDQEWDVILPLVEGAGVAPDEATLFHAEMWVYVHGIATILATSYLSLDEDLISRMLTDAFQGLLTRFRQKTEGGSFLSSPDTPSSEKPFKGDDE